VWIHADSVVVDVVAVAAVGFADLQQIVQKVNS